MLSNRLDFLHKESESSFEQIGRGLNSMQKAEQHLSQIKDEYGRVTDICGQAGYILDNIDKDFKEKTQLTSSDIVLLFLCTAIQCARQYLLSNNTIRFEDDVGLFVANIPDLWIQTISNAVLVLLGFYLLLFMYMLGSLHTYLNILVPYTVNLMEEKINIYNLQCIEEDENQPTYRVKVKRKRR